MKQLYSRAHEALLAVSRQDFVSGADLAPSITGHSIPREETVWASQTGHVVLSTLHCNDAVDSL